MIVQMIHTVFTGTVTLRAVTELHVRIILFCFSADAAAVKRNIIDYFAGSLMGGAGFLNILFAADGIADLLDELRAEEQDIVQEAGKDHQASRPAADDELIEQQSSRQEAKPFYFDRNKEEKQKLDIREQSGKRQK